MHVRASVTLNSPSDSESESDLSSSSSSAVTPASSTVVLTINMQSSSSQHPHSTSTSTTPSPSAPRPASCWTGWGSFHSPPVEVLIHQSESEYSPPTWPEFARSCHAPRQWIRQNAKNEQADTDVVHPSSSSSSAVILARPSLYAPLFLLEPGWTFLNHGAFGACLRPMLQVRNAWTERMESQPLRFLDREILPLLVDAIRQTAKFVGCPPTTLTLHPNATTALNILFNSLRVHFQSEATSASTTLSSSSSSAASPTTAPSASSSRRILFRLNITYGAVKKMTNAMGLEVVEIPVPIPLHSRQQLLQLVESELDRLPPGSVQLAVFDEVASNSAIKLPTKQLIDICHKRGIPVLIDGAHALGSVPLDLEASGVDFYVTNAHKWLCNPKGCALMYVASKWHPIIRPLIISHGTGSGYTSDFIWTGCQDYAPLLTLPSTLSFWSQAPGGLNAVSKYCHDLVVRAGRFLAARWGTDLLVGGEDNDESREETDALTANMICVRLPGPLEPLHDDEHNAIQYALFAQRIEVPIKKLGDASSPRLFVRISAHLYNNMEQYERLGDVMWNLRGAPHAGSAGGAGATREVNGVSSTSSSASTSTSSSSSTSPSSSSTSSSSQPSNSTQQHLNIAIHSPASNSSSQADSTLSHTSSTSTPPQILSSLVVPAPSPSVSASSSDGSRSQSDEVLDPSPLFTPSPGSFDKLPDGSRRAILHQPRVLRLDHAQVCIPPGPAARQLARSFYLGALGLKEVPRPAELSGLGGWWMLAGQCHIHVGTESLDAGHYARSKQHIAYAVRNLDGWMSRLRARNIAVSSGIHIPGSRRIDTRDPFGNKIELIEYSGGLWEATPVPKQETSTAASPGSENKLKLASPSIHDHSPSSESHRSWPVSALSSHWPTPYFWSTPLAHCNESLLRVGVVQATSFHADIESNLGVFHRMLLQAKEAGVNLVVFPELFLTDYDLSPQQMRALAMKVDDQRIDKLRQWCKDCGVACCVGYAELGRADEEVGDEHEVGNDDLSFPSNLPMPHHHFPDDITEHMDNSVSQSPDSIDTSSDIGTGEVAPSSVSPPAMSSSSTSPSSPFHSTQQPPLYNSALLISEDGEILHNYRKIQLWMSTEKSIFTPGDASSLRTCLVGGVRVGINICYDIEFPELSRVLALQGVQLLLVPTALARGQVHEVVPKLVVPTRAADNHIWIAYANLVGRSCSSSSLEMCGLSGVIGPDGVDLSRANDSSSHPTLDIDTATNTAGCEYRKDVDNAQMFVADLIPGSYVDRFKTTPLLLDRRSELFAELSARKEWTMPNAAEESQSVS